MPLFVSVAPVANVAPPITVMVPLFAVAPFKVKVVDVASVHPASIVAVPLTVVARAVVLIPLPDIWRVVYVGKSVIPSVLFDKRV